MHVELKTDIQVWVHTASCNTHRVVSAVLDSFLKSGLVPVGYGLTAGRILEKGASGTPWRGRRWLGW
jgi:hypothetical protein